MAEEIDPALYVRPPKFDVPSGVTLGLSPITAMPKPAPDHVRAAATKVRKDTVALQVAWGKSGTGGATRDRRKSDIRIDNAWGILLDRLEFARSIGKYRLAVVTMAGDDAASITVVRKALRPIDDFREGQARRARAGGAAVDAEPEVPVSPTTPIPEVK